MSNGMAEVDGVVVEEVSDDTVEVEEECNDSTATDAFLACQSTQKLLEMMKEVVQKTSMADSAIYSNGDSPESNSESYSDEKELLLETQDMLISEMEVNESQQKRIYQLQEQVSCLQLENKKLRSQFISVFQKLTNQRNMLEELRSEAGAKGAAATELQVRVSEQSAELQALRVENAALRSEQRALGAYAADMEAQLLASRRQQEALRRDGHMLLAQRDALQGRLATLMAENQALTMHKRRCHQHIVQLQEQINSDVAAAQREAAFNAHESFLDSPRSTLFRHASTTCFRRPPGMRTSVIIQEVPDSGSEDSPLIQEI